MAARRKKADLPSTPDADHIHDAPPWVADVAFQDAELDRLRVIEQQGRLAPGADEITSGTLTLEKKRVGGVMREAIIYSPAARTAYGGSELANMAIEDRFSTMAGTDSVIGLGSLNLTQVQKTCVGYYLNHPLARNIITAYTFLVIGEGVKVNWTTTAKGPEGHKEEPEVATRNQDQWDEKAEQEGFQQYVRRMVRMTFLTGEWFTAFVGDKMRGIEPDRVTRIFYAASDIDDVRGYEVRMPNQQRAILRPEDVIHTRIGEIGNIPRGLPILLPVLVPLRYYQLFLENRHWINMVRARLPVIRKMKTGGAAISTERARISTLPKPGTVAIDPESADWQFPSHNIGASDAAEDGRLIRLTIAAGVNLPEFLVTADASNANYSSSLVAESPTVRNVLDYQDIFRAPIAEFVRRISGKKTGFTIEFPAPIRRSAGEQAAAIATLVDRGIISKQTGCTIIGQKWTGKDGERSRIAREEAEGGVGLGQDAALDGDQPKAPDPFGKRQDGGNGEAKTGGSLGATASSDAAKARA